MTHEGYPVYLLTILGVWSLCGGITLLLPGFPRLKEWAYAGIFFELTGALASGIVRGGDPATVIWPPLILAVLAVASWALRPSGQTDAASSFPRERSRESSWCASPHET